MLVASTQSKKSLSFLKVSSCKPNWTFVKNTCLIDCMDAKPNFTRELLKRLKIKQQFRVAVGKSKWVNYSKFSPKYNLREILNDEVVIEFDMPKKWNKGLKQFQELSMFAVNATAINLYNAGIEFSIWDHKGKSPHIHIHNLPISKLDKDKRKKFKEIFQKRYVPKEYHNLIDTSLCGIHLVRLEWTPCWKGKYGVKELLHEFNPQEDKQ